MAASVVADPSTSEVVLAERGRGAWAMGGDGLRRVATSVASRMVVVEEGKANGAAPDPGGGLRRGGHRGRPLGLPLVRLDALVGLRRHRSVSAYAAFVIWPCTARAGSLLVTEAGGVLTDLEGGVWVLDSPTLLASADPALHDELLALVVELWMTTASSTGSPSSPASEVAAAVARETGAASTSGSWHALARRRPV